MNEKEKIIIEELRKNARSALTYLAYKAEMPVSTTYNKLKELENKVIKKHTSLVDFKELGYPVWNSIILKIGRDDRSAVKNYLLAHKDVNSIFEIDTGYDFMAETLHEDQTKFKEFTEELMEKFDIREMHKIAIVKDIQRERFLTK
jgi:DNA-binding Lrp family transcriptional regulator